MEVKMENVFSQQEIKRPEERKVEQKELKQKRYTLIGIIIAGLSIGIPLIQNIIQTLFQ